MNTLTFIKYMEENLLNAGEKCKNESEGPEMCKVLGCAHFINGECAEIRYVRAVSHTLFRYHQRW